MSEEDDFNGTSSEEDGEGGFNMAAIWFGNVDSDGQLEADFLDEVCRTQGLNLALSVR